MKIKSFIILFCIVLCAFQTQAQDEKKLYDPTADAEQQIADALAQAKETNKHVFVQIGGNWCSWCILFHQFVEGNETVKSVFNDNYVPVKLNYSSENKNEEMLAKLGYPNRFGFPVFVILDAEGNRIHTQDSALLEDGKGYSEKKVVGFFKNWSSTAVNPATYAEK
ncbi:MAG: thioredoxin family protein [Cyclobacteriaceae bacterium]